MRILHVISGLNTGGAERALFNLLSGGLSKQIKCCVISLIDEGTVGLQIKHLGVPVCVLGMSNGRPSIKSLMKLNKIVREFRPDLIQGWMYHGNLVASLARVLSNGHPALAWNIRHSLYDLSDEKPMTQKVIRLNSLFSSGPDVLLYNSVLSKEQHETFGLSSSYGQVIPNGIDVEKFSFSSISRQKIRSELGIPESVLVVGHVARLHPIKDHPLFLKAAVNIAQNDLTIHFILSGRDVTFQRDEMKKLVPETLRNRFHLLDERSDIPDLMSAMDVFCLSSWSEAFPNVIGEAMAMGLPCVSTNVGDSQLIIRDTGVLVKAKSEKALTSGMEKLLSLSHQERQNLGKKARRRIEKNFTLDVLVKKYIELYQQLIVVKRVG